MKLQVFDTNKAFDPDSVVFAAEGIDRDGNFMPDGIFSERIWGSMTGDTTSYKCKCPDSKNHGKFWEGVKCKVCNSPITANKSTLDKKGWVDLGESRIINPIIMLHLENLISKKDLSAIISLNDKLDIDGNIIEEDEVKRISPYLKDNSILGIGVVGLIDRFDEVLSIVRDNLTDLSAGREASYNFIMKERDKALTRYIPIFSHRMRPAIVVNKEVTFDKINNQYNMLVKTNNHLQDLVAGEDIRLTRAPLINSLQNTYNTIFVNIIDLLGGKDGWARSNLLANRVNFSARLVISPLSTGHSMDEIVIPYKTAVELFKFNIINALVSADKRVTYAQAYAQWNKASRQFNNKVYGIINTIINEPKDGYYVFINRPPTIQYGSILCVKIKAVKKDFNDLTMELHNLILPLLAGDFDGKFQVITFNTL